MEATPDISDYARKAFPDGRFTVASEFKSRNYGELLYEEGVYAQALSL
jgi:hypothetical protein